MIMKKIVFSDPHIGLKNSGYDRNPEIKQCFDASKPVIGIIYTSYEDIAKTLLVSLYYCYALLRQNEARQNLNFPLYADTLLSLTWKRLLSVKLHKLFFSSIMTTTLDRITHPSFVRR